jgi:VIT1/CCC1 family predicted Fe2+/Mn2+ transporter
VRSRRDVRGPCARRCCDAPRLTAPSPRTLSAQVIIVTGFAKLLGDALAMGLGDAISESAEHTLTRGEYKREAWEFKNYPEGEVAEMVDIYVGKGFSREDAARAIGIMTRKPEYTDAFIKHMLVQELEKLVLS